MKVVGNEDVSIEKPADRTIRVITDYRMISTEKEIREAIKNAKSVSMTVRLVHPSSFEPMVGWQVSYKPDLASDEFTTIIKHYAVPLRLVQDLPEPVKNLLRTFDEVR